MLSDVEVRKPLATTSGLGFAERRDRPLVYLFYDTGARRGEVEQMRLEDVDLEGSKCELAKRGYSWDGKRGLPQIEFGLLTNREGCPGRSTSSRWSTTGISS